MAAKASASSVSASMTSLLVMKEMDALFTPGSWLMPVSIFAAQLAQSRFSSLNDFRMVVPFSAGSLRGRSGGLRVVERSGSLGCEFGARGAGYSQTWVMPWASMVNT